MKKEIIVKGSRAADPYSPEVLVEDWVYLVKGLAFVRNLPYGRSNGVNL